MEIQICLGVFARMRAPAVPDDVDFLSGVFFLQFVEELCDDEAVFPVEECVMHSSGVYVSCGE